LMTFDPTVDALDGQYHGSLATVRDAVVSATTPDGATLILGAPAPATDSWALYFVATADHQQEVREPLGLRQPPSDVVVSPSGRYAVVAHAGDETITGGLTVIDLHAPDDIGRFVALGQVDRVAVTKVSPDSDQER